MGVYLIQTNGRKISEDAAPEYVRGAKGPTFADEPLRHHRYFNATPYWQRGGYGRRDAWESAGSGDTALLYCSSSVDEHSRCLSHVLPIDEKRIDGEGALLELGEPVELAPKIGYQDIQKHVERGRFSEKMAYCGQQGFNFTQVEDRDLETVKELSRPLHGDWP